MEDAPVCVPADRDTLAAAGADTAAIAEFLQHILGGEETGVGQLLIFTKPDCRSGFFTSAIAAAQYGASHSSAADVYVGVGLRRDGLPDHQRGGNDDVVALLGLVADIDVAGPAHADDTKPYPPNGACAEVLLSLLSAPPTIVVDSGHGLHAWWLFEQPWLLTDRVEHARATALSTAWQDHIACHAAALGYQVDRVGDLARIMRVAGTMNRKVESIVPVTVLRADGPRYTSAQLAAVVQSRTAATESTTSHPDRADDLVLDPAAEPPVEKFEHLLVRKPDFRASWERQRTDLKDRSASGYDLSVARFAMNDGWSRQEIVDLLIAHRRKHNDDLKLRDDYYAQTLRKVAASASAKPSTTGDSRSTREPSHAAHLLAIANHVELFHTPAKVGYATFVTNGSTHTAQILGAGRPSLRDHLYCTYRRVHGRAPSSQAVRDVLQMLDSQAVVEGPEHQVYTRIATAPGIVWVHLANDEGDVVEITPRGYQLITNPPVRFTRHGELAPLPRPVAGGSLRELKPFVNVGSAGDWVLVQAFLLGCFGPLPCFPLLVTTGQHGSAKSTQGRVLKALVDPAFQAATRSLPDDERDLVIAASRSHLMVFSNISALPFRMSDSLCRLASGEGFGTRALYTDGGEVVFGGPRPVVLNGIEDVVTRGDLLDRSIVLTLPRIDETNLKTEEEFWLAFEQARPRILGAVCNAVSIGLRNLPTTTLPRRPRMADFAVWVVACEAGLDMPAGEFLKAYEANRRVGVERALDASPVAEALIVWAHKTLSNVPNRRVEVTATDLLDALTKEAVHFGDEYAKQRDWPKRAHVFSGKLRRLQPALATVGITIEFEAKRTERQRLLRITLATPSTGAPAADAS